MIGLINYGSGNFKSVLNALNFLDIKFLEIQNYKDLKSVEHIILPGVGSYNDLINRLISKNIFNELIYAVTEKKNISLEYVWGCKF